MERIAFSSSSSSLAGGTPRAVLSDGDVAAVAGARPDGRGGLPSLPDLIALGRGGPASSTAGGQSVATVHRPSLFDPNYVYLAATDRAVASDQGLTEMTSQRGPGGPANTPRDMARRRDVFAPPRTRDAGANGPPPSSAARRRADAQTTEVDTTEAEEMSSAWAAACTKRRHGASLPTDDSAAQMRILLGRRGHSVRGSQRLGGRRPETAVDTTESQLLITEMRQELRELRRLRDWITETASFPCPKRRPRHLAWPRGRGRVRPPCRRRPRPVGPPPWRASSMLGPIPPIVTRIPSIRPNRRR